MRPPEGSLAAVRLTLDSVFIAPQLAYCVCLAAATQQNGGKMLRPDVKFRFLQHISQRNNKTSHKRCVAACKTPKTGTKKKTASLLMLSIRIFLRLMLEFSNRRETCSSCLPANNSIQVTGNLKVSGLIPMIVSWPRS